MGAPPYIRSFFDEATNTVTHLVGDPATGQAAVIDPVLDYDAAAGRVSTRSVDEVLAAAQTDGWTISWSLETHAHADHLSAAPIIKQRTGARIGIGEHIRTVRDVFGPMLDVQSEDSDFDALFADGERFKIGAPDRWSAWAWVSRLQLIVQPPVSAAASTSSTDRVETLPAAAS